MFKYCCEINLDNIILKPLTKDNFYLVKGFCCENEVFDNFLLKEALFDNSTKTYLILYENILLGFFSLSASGISIINDSHENKESHRFNISAIEISHFALNKHFHHLYYDRQAKEENEKYFLSDICLEYILTYIVENVTTIIGAKFIILYSIPKAESLYKRLDFKNFESFMIPNHKRYYEGCTAFFLKINN